MGQKRITRNNVSLLSIFFDYEYLASVDPYLAGQVHNLTVYLDAGINYENVRAEVGTILKRLNSILAKGKLFAGRRMTGRLDMECDKAVELIKYSIRLSRIVPGWYYPSGRLCKITHQPVWWKIASVAWEEQRMVLRREDGEIIALLDPPEQTAGYSPLAIPVGVEPPALNEDDEQLVLSMVIE